MSNINKSGIGVLGGQCGAERSIADQKLQKEFGMGISEAYCQSDIGILTSHDYGRRSAKDVAMQKMFNPYYEGNRENYAKITDDPYNPLSSKVKYVPIM